ncbi:hypothetical protein RJT34_16449 [Clitoria ternatea]|uniref:Uncharacterized protein n=1 Tax=Clitoria ternatea TaxID=43366 RepID=A0AAN9J8P7_CLITE
MWAQCGFGRLNLDIAVIIENAIFYPVADTSCCKDITTLLRGGVAEQVYLLLPYRYSFVYVHQLHGRTQPGPSCNAVKASNEWDISFA